MYRRAHRDAVRLAKRLGPGWKPATTHNMGWYAFAVSKCGRVKVHLNRYRGRVDSYSAFLGEPGLGGGRWAVTVNTPETAVRQVVRQAKASLAKIGALIEGLPTVPRRPR